MRRLTEPYRADGVAVHALNGIDLELEPGSYTCIMGQSGSGTTTLLNCLLGLERSDSGEVRIGDADVTRLDETQLAELRRRLEISTALAAVLARQMSGGLVTRTPIRACLAAAAHAVLQHLDGHAIAESGDAEPLVGYVG